jgi:phosphatidylglycerophosphate synthase
MNQDFREFAKTLFGHFRDPFFEDGFRGKISRFYRNHKCSLPKSRDDKIDLIVQLLDNEPEEVKMLTAKQVADLVTLLRAFIGLGLVWLGLTEGAQGLHKAVLLMIAAWTGDTLDGKIARRDKGYYHTWIGDHDLEIDMAVSAGLLVYMIISGFVTLWIAGVYVLFCALILWRWRNFNVLGMLSQAPVYGYFIWIALTRLPNVGIWIIVWIVVAIIITWPQFPEQVVPGFLNGMREFLANRSEIRRDR